MNRRNLLKSLATISLSPLILPLAKIMGEEKKEVNKGLLYEIQNGGTTFYYQPGYFSIEDFKRMVEVMDRNQR